MSSSSDNAMTRFLFAILRQKNLKDIDWNKVAHDPILAQEITNGHAARMRYSRFRKAMLGLEPTRRNRTGPPKSRVTKSKKEPKPKRDERTKSESGAASSSATPQVPERPAPKIKQELSQHVFENRLENRLTPGLTPGPMQAPAPAPAPAPSVATPHTMQSRLLTPCSDSDALVSAQYSSPTNDMLRSHEASFDFPQPPCSAHDHSAWHYSPFSSPYIFDDFTPSACDHQPYPFRCDGLPLESSQTHGLPSVETDEDQHHPGVKHEEWESCI